MRENTNSFGFDSSGFNNLLGLTIRPLVLSGELVPDARKGVSIGAEEKLNVTMQNIQDRVRKTQILKIASPKIESGLKPIDIKDVDGNIIHSGRAISRKALVERLVGERKSLARADFSKADLSHLDLTGGDFAMAKFDGADFRGTKASRANFRGASLRGIKAEGMLAKYADFSDADLSRNPETKLPSTLNGCVLSFSTWDRANLNHASFSGASMSSTTMIGTRARRADFTDAVLHNADWVDSEIISCNFTRAIMRPTHRIAAQHLPDRTRGATIVGNTMKDAEIGVGNREFVLDSYMSRGEHLISWLGVTTALATASMYVPLDEVEYIQAHLGTGFNFVFAATAAIVLKDRLQDVVKDNFIDSLTNLYVKTRRVIAGLAKDGKALASLAVAFVSPEEGDLVMKAIRDPQKSLFARFKAGVRGEFEVIIADRTHLAEALMRITDSYVGRHRQDTDIVITRSSSVDDVSPRAMILRRDGSMEVVWSNPVFGFERMKWSAEGELTTPIPDCHWSGKMTGRDEMLDTFTKLILLDNGFPEMNFDPQTHSVRQGRDGSVVVVNRSTGRINNPDGPIIITPNDETIWKGRAFSNEFEVSAPNEEEANVPKM